MWPAGFSMPSPLVARSSFPDGVHRSGTVSQPNPFSLKLLLVSVFYNKVKKQVTSGLGRFYRGLSIIPTEAALIFPKLCFVYSSMNNTD